MRQKKTKVCGRCKKRKLIKYFGKNRTRSDGLDNRCKECCKKARKLFYENNKERLDKYWRGFYLKQEYNITSEQYSELFNKQQGKCAICGKHQSKLSQTLCVDHSHESGKIRGLLCKGCNSRLGTVEDFEFILKANKYLKNNG